MISKFEGLAANVNADGLHAKPRRKAESTTEAFDNSKNPVAYFKGLRSIFREHREKQKVGKELQKTNGSGRVRRRSGTNSFWFYRHMTEI